MVYEQVKTEFSRGNVVEANRASRLARTWIIVATTTGSVLLVITGILTTLQAVGMANSGDNEQQYIELY